MGYSATQAGMVLAPVGVLAILFTPLVGKNVHRVDPRLFATGAFIVMALVLYMRSKFNTSADLWTLMVPTIIQGAGMAIFFIPLVTLSLSGLEPDRIPAASGLFNFTRITAGSFGTSLATTLWDHRATLHHAQIAENVGGADPVSTQALAALQAGGLSPQQSVAQLNRLVDQQAFMLSANDVFYASAVIFLLLVAVIWLARTDARSRAATPCAATGRTSIFPRSAADIRRTASGAVSHWRHSPVGPASRRGRPRLRAGVSHRAIACTRWGWLRRSGSWDRRAEAASRPTRRAHRRRRSCLLHPGTCKPPRARPEPRARRRGSPRRQGR
jgi:hypothetical protein